MYKKSVAACLVLGVSLGTMFAVGHLTKAYPAIAIAGAPAVGGTITPPGPGETALHNFLYPPGVSAIQPVTSTTSLLATAFSQANVVQYLATHRLFKTVGTNDSTVARVLFIPALQASTLLHGEWIGRPDNALVCYVEVAGPIDTSTSGLDVPPGVKLSQFKPAPKGILVFDAQTGNLLIRGTGGY